MSETNILQECRLAVSEMGGIAWRNNTGKLQDSKGRWVTFGLCVGSADLIGIYQGRFLAIECKAPGKNPTLEQTNFINAVIKAGGIAGVCRCADDVRKLLHAKMSC